MEIPIIQDIRKYKTKDIGNFSFKEAGFIALGIGLGIATYKLTDSFEVALFPLILTLIFAFFKPYELTFIQFLRTVVIEKLFTPFIYIWETDFEYNVDELEKLYGEKIQISSEWYDTIDDSVKNKKINKQDVPFVIT